jgi:hypothetical protein
MSLMKQKKKKLEKLIRNVDPKYVTQVINRYQRFCMD